MRHGTVIDSSSLVETKLLPVTPFGQQKITIKIIIPKISNSLIVIILLSVSPSLSILFFNRYKLRVSVNCQGVIRE
jgi:hypothetical protein